MEVAKEVDLETTAGGGGDVLGVIAPGDGLQNSMVVIVGRGLRSWVRLVLLQNWF